MSSMQINSAYDTVKMNQRTKSQLGGEDQSNSTYETVRPSLEPENQIEPVDYLTPQKIHVYENVNYM